MEAALGYMVGVVGKPNVGKSTFFSAATLISVPIANYPFTTIKPNRGMGYVRTPCVCREFDVQDEPVNSACVGGTRLVPVELVDCAGLVPGAWQGRGLGNRFLDEISRADALVQIVDAAGATDTDGRMRAPGTHDPSEDVKFLENEIVMWILQIVRKDWVSMARKSEGTKDGLVCELERSLSGLAIKGNHVVKAIESTQLDPAKATSWKDEDLVRLLANLRKIAKPMLIAANKIDLPTASDNIERLRKLGHIVVPCCAEAELGLRRASEKRLIDYTPGDSNFSVARPDEVTTEQKEALEKIRQRILVPFGSTGVQDAINLAFFNLLRMVAVYPVEDVEKLSDHSGKVLPDVYLTPYGTTAKQFAYSIHSDLGESFIYAIEARSRMRVGEDYVLKDRDVISIASAKKRG